MMKYRMLALMVLVVMVSGCGSPAPALTPPSSRTSAAVPHPSTQTLTPRPTTTVHPPAMTPTAAIWPTPSPAPDYPLVSPDDAALPAGALMRQGIGIVLDSDLHPDGTQVALGTSTGVYIYRVPELTQVWRRITAYPVFGISWSPDGTRLLTSYEYYAPPTLWTSDGVVLRELDGFLEGQWSPDSTMIAVPYYDRLDIPRWEEGERIALMLFDGHNGAFLRSLKAVGDIYITGEKTHWSPDSTLVASESQGVHRIHVWNAASGVQVLDHRAPYSGGGQEGTYGFESPHSLLWATYEFRFGAKWVIVVNLNEQRELLEAPLGGLAEYFLVWSPDMRTIYAEGYTEVFVIGMASSSVDRLPIEHASIQTSASAGDLTALIGGNELYVMRGVELLGSFAGSDKGSFTHGFNADWLPDGRLLIVDGLGLYLSSDGRLEQGFATSVPTINVSWASPDTVQVGASTERWWEHDADVWLWTISSNRFANTGQHMDGPVYPTGLLGGSVRIQDIDPLVSSAGHRVSFHLDEQRYASITRADGSTFLIDLTGKPFAGMNWSPDGETLLLVFNGGMDVDGPFIVSSVYNNGRLGVWDVSSGVLLRELTFDQAAIAAVWSPDGRKLAVGLGATSNDYYGGIQDSAIIVVNPFTGEGLIRFEGHGGAISDLAWSPDGTRLVSSSDDGTLILWDVSQISEP